MEFPDINELNLTELKGYREELAQALAELEKISNSSRPYLGLGEVYYAHYRKILSQKARVDRAISDQSF